MKTLNVNPIVNACLRLFQSMQGTSASGVIKDVLASQTETMPTGYAAITDLAPVVSFEKDVKMIVSKTPCLTVVGQTKFANPRLNEGANVIHTMTAEVYAYQAKREIKMAECYLYGQLLYEILIDRTDDDDFIAGVSGVNCIGRIPQSLVYGASELEHNAGFAGGATLTFDVLLYAR